MSRVLLATLGSLGDLHPLIALGLTLRQRGHSVSFCTSAVYQTRIESLGFGFHPLVPDLSPETTGAEHVVREIMEPKRGVERLLRKYLFPNLRAQLELHPGRDPIYEGKHSPQLVLALFSPTLATPQPDWPPNTVVTGFPFYDGSPERDPLTPELARFLSTGEAPIVFTLGSAAVMDPGNFYNASAEAAGLLKRRAILLVGLNPPPARLPECVLCAGYVRFSQLFPHASAIVHQGGIGTMGQALRAGCPMLVMPYNYDQPDNAARVVRLGVGRTVARREYSAARAARELAQLLADPTYSRAAQEIGRRIQLEQGAETAGDALEKLLAT